MLTASKSAWFEKIFALYNRNLFRRRFRFLHVCGLEKLREREKDIPLIVYANHSSWWDGLTAFEISRLARLDSFVMMEEKQLKKLPLFRKLGAFSVVRESPKEAVKSINYAARVLTEKQNRCLWIFPQGEILPSESRPIKFFSGLNAIIKKIGFCNTISLAVKYEFLNDFKPEIFARFGEMEKVFAAKISMRGQTRFFENSLTATLENLKTDIKNQSFENFFKI